MMLFESRGLRQEWGEGTTVILQHQGAETSVRSRKRGEETPSSVCQIAVPSWSSQKQGKAKPAPCLGEVNHMRFRL